MHTETTFAGAVSATQPLVGRERHAHTCQLTTCREDATHTVWLHIANDRSANSLTVYLCDTCTTAAETLIPPRAPIITTDRTRPQDPAP